MSQIAFCTTCRLRNKHLELTLPRNLADNPRSRFVLVNYNDEPSHPEGGLLNYVFSEFPSEIESGRLVVYSHLVPGLKYQFAHAKNLAHRLGIREGAEFLVSQDADNYTTPHFEDFAEREFAKLPNAFLWARMRRDILPRGINGRIAVSAQTFLKLGGYDEEKFKEWGSEDKDFHLRLTMADYEDIEIPPSYLRAELHNDKVRFRDYPYVADTAYSADYHRVDRSTIEKIVVNAGVVGCGQVFKNNDFDSPIDIKPIPTRIFGVGMQKTATTSLHQALKHLGFDSWHWNKPHHAESIWSEMSWGGRSPTLETWYALSDLPICLLYRKLDEAYPGSKFILTTRNELGWLDSVRRHFDPEHNRFQPGWDNDSFSHTAHELLYGRRDFDAQTFLERYRRHNAEVLEYFRDRLDDLLVMDMDAAPGWKALCQFLDRPVPKVAYPHAYHTEAS